MIKSSKSSLKFCNTGKLVSVNRFIEEYKSVMSEFIDLLWNEEKISNLLPKNITSQITNTWLSARAIQCAGKQASGIIRGTRKKQEQRKYIIEKLLNRKEYKKARKLQAIYDINSISKPKLDNIQPELDSRFIKINLENKTSFDGWIHISSLGEKLKLSLPFKKHDHFNKMLSKGKVKTGIRLSKNSITFMFDLEEPKQIEEGKVIGIDVGQKSILSCSNGQVINYNPHGYNYQIICEELARKKKGSKNFKKVQTHRTNYINWSINQLNLKDIKQVNLENIKDLNKGRNTSRSLKHWNYGELFDKLEMKLNDSGVQIMKLNPTYTSQRCSSCGWVRKSNRNGKAFKCDKCDYVADSDLNASLNLSLYLIPIGKQERLLHKNRTGFYWHEASRESIVPNTQETKSIEKFQYSK